MKVTETTDLFGLKVSKTDVQNAIRDSSVRINGFCSHAKAQEKYVVIVKDGKEWFVPYSYRRTNIEAMSVREMAHMVDEAAKVFNDSSIETYKFLWRKLARTDSDLGGDVTLPIFMLLLENCGQWVSNKVGAFAVSSNPQRRIQKIKESGFTIVTKTEGRTTFHCLLPFEKRNSFGYETFSPALRKRIFKVLGNTNVFANEPVDSSCLPDHKFPEIRWDENTPVSNEDMTDAAIARKFQLIPERINQMKREVCRECYATGVRGRLLGIDFFYSGDGKWRCAERRGKSVERGCVGCFWYDMAKWRHDLHEKLRRHR